MGRASLGIAATGVLPAVAVVAGGVYLAKVLIEAAFEGADVRPLPDVNRRFIAEERVALRAAPMLSDTRTSRGMSRVLHRHF